MPIVAVVNDRRNHSFARGAKAHDARGKRRCVRLDESVVADERDLARREAQRAEFCPGKISGLRPTADEVWTIRARRGACRARMPTSDRCAPRFSSRRNKSRRCARSPAGYDVCAARLVSSEKFCAPCGRFDAMPSAARCRFARRARPGEGKKSPDSLCRQKFSRFR